MVNHREEGAAAAAAAAVVVVVHLIRGGGCHAAVTWETLQLQQQQQEATTRPTREENDDPSNSNIKVLVWDDGEGAVHSAFHDGDKYLRVRGRDECRGAVLELFQASPTTASPTQIEVRCYVAVGDGALRRRLVESVHAAFDCNASADFGASPGSRNNIRLVFPTVIHPRAVVSPTAAIGEGCYVGPLAIVNPHAVVGAFVLVNSGAIVEHDCCLGDCVTVAPGAVVLGSCLVAADAYLGANATVRERCSIGPPGTTVAMNAAVVGTIPDRGNWDDDHDDDRDGFWAGVPAKFKRKTKETKNKKKTKEEDPEDLDDTVQDTGSVCSTITIASTTTYTSASASSSAGEDASSASMLISPMRWCYKKPFSLERFHRYLEPSLEAGQVTNGGPAQAGLGDKLQAFIGSRRPVLMTSSGTSALHALAAAIALRKIETEAVASPGAPPRAFRWVTQAYTFPPSMQGPMQDAVVADLDPELLGPCLNFLERRKDEIDGVVVTNLFGMQARVLVYEEWCRTNDKALIFDNAASPIGFADDGRCIQDIGDGAIVSLHETKPIGRGEGGAVFIDADLYSFVHRAMNYGYDIPHAVRTPHRICSNFRMSDFAAAAICDHIDHMIENDWKGRLERSATLAIDYLSTKDSVDLALPAAVRFPTVPSCLMIQTKNSSEAVQALQQQGVDAKKYYEPLLPRDAAPVSWGLYDRTLCLPFHLGISDEELCSVIDLLDDLHSLGE